MARFGRARERIGNYEPLLELASGGMGTVSLARHTGPLGFERLVVLKRVHRHLAKDREFHDMFVDEARVASLIRHPNVVPVIDVVEESGELFLVQEYVESMSMHALVTAARAAGEPLPVPVVVRIVADALAGLHAAHEATDVQGNPLEVVHRDVSPQNIVVGLDGTSRLVDFGIAKAHKRLTVTSGGVLKGKFGYMAPEQLKQLHVDRRADVFSTGVVLFEALTGQKPFAAVDDGDALLALLIGDIEDPSTLAPGVPPKLDAVVQYALARDRDERFQTAAAFLQALETALPPAPPREVAAFVKRFGGADLELRRKAMRAILEEWGEATGPTPPPRAEAGQSKPAPRAGSDPEARPTAGSSAETTMSAYTPAAGDEPIVPKRPLLPRGVWLGGVAVALVVAVAVLANRKPAPSSTAPSADPAGPSAVATGPVVSAATTTSAATDGAVELVLVADAAIEAVRAPGIKRLELDGLRAHVWLTPWTGTLALTATLAGGATVKARVEAGAGGEVVLAAPKSAGQRATGVPATTGHAEPASTPSGLKKNPYGP